MADGADINLLEDDLAQIRRQDEETRNRNAALDAFVGENIPRPDALANARAAERLGMDRDEVALTPLARQEARRGELNNALQSGRNIEEWLAARRSNAALAEPDVERMIRTETNWRAVAEEYARNGFISDADRAMANRIVDAQQRQQREADRRAIELSNELGTAEGRDRIMRDAERQARQVGSNLSNPDWWQAQQRAAGRSISHAWDNTREFFESLPEVWRDVQVQYEVGTRMQEQADIGWRMLNGAELPGDRARLAELRGANRFPLVSMGPATQSFPLGARGMAGGDQRAAIEFALREQGADTSALYPEPTTWFGAAAQSAPMSLRGLLAGIKGGLQTGMYGAAVGAGSTAIYGQAGPQIATAEELVTVPAGTVSGFVATFGPGAQIGAGTAMMQTEAGLAYTEYTDPNFVDENGRPLDPRLAARAAYIVGAINGGLEVLSLGNVVSRLPGGNVLLAGGSEAQIRARMRNLLRRRDFRAALTRLGRNIVEVGVVEGATEYAQESVTISGQRWAVAQDGGEGFPLPTHQEAFQRALRAGYFGFQAGTVFGGAAGGVTFTAVDAPRAFRTHRDAQHLEALAEQVRAMELSRAGVPGVMEEAADAMTRDGPAEVYVDANQFVRFFQSNNVDPDEVADQLPGVGREALAEAIEAGSSVAIPSSTVASRLMGSDVWDGLRDHARLTPDGLTPHELRQIQANEPELMREVEAIVRRQERAGDAAEDYQRIEAALNRQVDQAGVTIPDANRVQNRLVATIIMNMARQSGRNPYELYEAYFGDIRGPFEDVETSQRPQDGQMAQQGPGDVAAEAARIKEASGLEELRLTLDENHGEVVVDLIAAPKKGRNKGAGSKAMAEVIAYADRNGLRVALTPSKRGGAFGTRSYAALVEFFKRQGFVENKGDNKDPNVTHAMYRPARGAMRSMAQETQSTALRFDARSVSPEDAGAGATPIPRPGSPDFAVLLDQALEKQASNEPLTSLEAWAIARAARGTGAIGLATGMEVYQGDDKPVRAGPLPPSGAQAVNTGSESNPASARARVSLSANRLTPEAETALKRLMADRDRLRAEIERRMEYERDLPEMEAARQDAAAMRNLAYCFARGMVRSAQAVATVGAGIGATLATMGAAGVLSPSEVADGQLPAGTVITPPADRRAVRTEAAPAARAPAPVTLPEDNPAEALAALPAEQAAAAVVPESISRASAVTALTEPDVPIATNNRASPQ